MKLGIDVRTKDAAELVKRLLALPETISAASGGMYHEDTGYTQVWLDTTLTEDQIDLWLYSQNGIDYVGVFGREV